MLAVSDMNRLAVKMTCRKVPQILGSVHDGSGSCPLRAVRTVPLAAYQLKSSAAILRALNAIRIGTKRHDNDYQAAFCFTLQLFACRYSFTTSFLRWSFHPENRAMPIPRMNLRGTP